VAASICTMSQAYEFTCSVQPSYLPDQSEPAQDVYTWQYEVTIRNTGTVTAQLVARHWVITDAHGHVEEVKGLAVVGHQPLLKPGEQFSYGSFTRLRTSTGTMSGSYFCVAEDGERFDAPIPPFALTMPRTLH
jgi:ApaG protein